MYPVTPKADCTGSGFTFKMSLFITVPPWYNLRP